MAPMLVEYLSIAKAYSRGRLTIRVLLTVSEVGEVGLTKVNDIE
jgi:hypothetical protein